MEITSELGPNMIDDEAISVAAKLKEGGSFFENPGSTTIEKVYYDPHLKIALVCFRTGHEYLYFSIEPELYKEFQEAESTGKFFASNIKNGPFKKLPTGDDSQTQKPAA